MLVILETLEGFRRSLSVPDGMKMVQMHRFPRAIYTNFIAPEELGDPIFTMRFYATGWQEDGQQLFREHVAVDTKPLPRVTP